MAEILFGIVFLGLVCTADGTQIIAVVDSQLAEYNPYLEALLTPNAGINTDMSVIVSNETQSILTLEKVCQEVQNGALILLDMSSPSVGPLIRSFARAHGLVIITIMDDSITLPIDKTDEFHLKVQPPGTAMLKVISDIVSFEKFHKVAVLYDKSFALHHTPRNVISGVLSHHIYHEITRNKTEMSEVFLELVDLEIENVFVIGASSSVDFILTEANKNMQINSEEINWFVLTKDVKVTCDGCERKTRFVLVEGDYTFANMNRYVDFMRREIFKWFLSLNLKVDEAFIYDMVRILTGHIPGDLPLVMATSCYDYGVISNETILNAEAIVNSLVNVTYSGVFGDITHDSEGIRQKVKLSIKRLEFSKGHQENVELLGTWTEANGLNVSTDSLIKEKSRKSYRVVVIPEVWILFLPTFKIFSFGTDSSGQLGQIHVRLLLPEMTLFAIPIAGFLTHYFLMNPELFHFRRVTDIIYDVQFF